MQLQLLVLALESALYPTLLTAVVILLNQPRRLALLASYLAGGLTISIGLGLGLIYALKSSGAVHNSRSGLSWTTDLAVGGLALVLAVALATRADARFAERRRAGRSDALAAGAEKREPISQRILSRGSAPIVFLAALAINLPGASYLVGLKDIAAAHHSTAQDIVLVLAFNAIMFLLAEVPLVGLIVNPQRTGELVASADGWVSSNGRRIAIALCLLLSGFLIVRGISGS
jgi:hypothetical protein